LGLQNPDSFESIIIQPHEPRAQSDAAVIFLHGYAGNFYVYCWEFAQAAAEASLVTICPSMDAGGAWWTDRGHKTFKTTLELATNMGFHRVYLAGLSNGAAGASVLALEFERSLSGVVLVSGGRATRAPSIPVLVVQGTTDNMMPAKYARAFVARNPTIQYREVQGGHLVFLSRHEKVRPIIAEFLRKLEEKRPPE
jgi:pimeloyl-ACP methyl ester carboxylesterase